MNVFNNNVIVISRAQEMFLERMSEWKLRFCYMLYVLLYVYIQFCFIITKIKHLHCPDSVFSGSYISSFKDLLSKRFMIVAIASFSLRRQILE